MFLNPTNFNRFLNRMGQTVQWRQAQDCPCRNTYSGSPDPACPVCEGSGQAWAPPVSCTVATTSMRVNREWAQFGQWESGDLVVSLPGDSPAYGMGEFDHLTFVNSSVPFSLVLTSGSEAALRFPVAAVRSASMIEDGELVDLPLPTVDADGMVVWPMDASGNSLAPSSGVQYSLSGRKHPEYFCYGAFPQDRAHHHGAALPRKVVLRKFDLFGRSS